jgi:hypothetical protein
MKTIHAQLKVKRGKTVAVEIPTDLEIQRIAMRMHKRGQECLETILGCQVLYRPRTEPSYSTAGVDPFTGARGQQSPPHRLAVPAEFTFGYDGPWKVVLLWKAGDDKPPQWFRYEDNLIRKPGNETPKLP